ncbi:MAG: hypothetical protein AMS21_09205 [Gemmatimonas sp. SG8_38_2]|nr:MAG: hypothetical protein AMS21_09205 [Gemmatimonas sp. SG8_38_2]
MQSPAAAVRLTVLFDDPARWQRHLPAVLVTGAAAVVGMKLAASEAISEQVGAIAWGIVGTLAGGAIGLPRVLSVLWCLRQTTT